MNIIKMLILNKINSYLFLITLLALSFCQTPQNNFTVSLFSAIGNVSMVVNNNASKLFTRATAPFDCSLNQLYTYTQPEQLYDYNAPYFIVVGGMFESVGVTLTTVHNNFQPTYSPITCSPPYCVLQIQNNCPQSINFFNYFDRILLDIQGLSHQLTFYVKCDDKFVTNTFQWGMVIMIAVITVLMFVVALYSKAWSLGGQGVGVNIWFVVVMDLAIIVGALIGYFSYEVITIILTILVFILGSLGVAICVNQIVFLFRFKILMIKLFKIVKIQFRILQLVSLVAGICTVVGWYFSSHNMLVNDIVCMCLIVACIKVFKFTSLKLAAIMILSFIAIEIAFSAVVYVADNQQYNQLFLNNYNFPFELQIPTINPVYLQKCAWLPFTSVVFPGMLFSYLRRFDTSRSTNLYLITATIIFMIGGIAWMFISVVSPIEFAFGLISEPCLIGLISIFAYRRIELRVLWEGKFYDEQFQNRDDLNYVLQMMAMENRSSTANTIDSRLIQQLKEKGEGSERESKMSAIQSRFIRDWGESKESQVRGYVPERQKSQINT